MHAAAGVLRGDLPPEGVVGVGRDQAGCRTRGDEEAVDRGREGGDGRAGGVRQSIHCLVAAVNDGAGYRLVATGVDGDRLGGEGAGRAVGGIRAAEAGEAGADDGVGERGGGAVPSVGPGGAFLPPVPGDLDVAGGAAADAVGAGEVDLAVEVDVLTGEKRLAEGVVGVELNIQHRTSNAQRPTLKTRQQAAETKEETFRLC